MYILKSVETRYSQVHFKKTVLLENITCWVVVLLEHTILVCLHFVSIYEIFILIYTLMQCLSSIQQPQGLTLVLTGKHKSHLMALIHYSNCFKYNHHQQKWGSTIFLTNFKQIVLISHIFLTHFLWWRVKVVPPP